MKNTVKKIIAVALSVIIIMSFSITAFAAPGSGEYVNGRAYVSGIYAMIYFEKYLLRIPMADGEEELWDYDEFTMRYTEEDGTIWRYFNNRNFIVCQSDERWLYQILKDDTLLITVNPDYPWEDVLEVTIPSVLDGKNVTILDEWGGNEALSVILPDSITEIGYDCFMNTKVKRIVLPATITKTNETAFMAARDVEIYYCGTEEQWNDIIVYHISDYFDEDCWAVTGYDWFGEPYSGENVYNDLNLGVKAIYFNADPDNLPPVETLIDPEPVEPTIWEKIAQAFQNFSDGIVIIFEMISDFFANLFKIG